MEKKWNWVKWQKMDLHIHTKKTARDRGNKKFITISEENVGNFINKIEENDVKLIAITNHNEVDYEQFQIIKKEADKKNLEVILGVEINGKWRTSDNLEKSFHFNLLMENAFLEENSEKINTKLKSLNTETKKGFLKDALDKTEIIELIISLKGRFILCLDYGKGSSNAFKTSFLNAFWFYFDIFEGNNKAIAQDLHNRLRGILEKENIEQVSKPPIIYGTDNRVFEDYPNNDTRKGWTGTFFLCEPSFDGLLNAIDFNFLVKTKNKTEDLNKPPELQDFELGFIDFLHKKDKIVGKKAKRIYFDRGINVILGRRGSGKSDLLREISNKLREKNVPFFELKQNQVTNIIEKGFKPNSIFKNQANFEIDYENIFSSFKNDIYESSHIENLVFEKIDIEILYRKLFDLIKSDKENIKISKEDSVINDLNKFFLAFNRDTKILQNIHILNNVFLDNQKNSVLKILLNSMDFDRFKKQINKIIREEISQININFQPNNLVKRNTTIIIEEIYNWIIEVKNIMEKRKNNFMFILGEIKNIFGKLKKTYSYTNKHSNILTFEVSLLLTNNIDNYVKEIGKYNKKKNLFENLGKFSEKLFWENDFIEHNKNKANFKENENAFKIIKKMNKKDVSTLSPGQMVEEYIKNIFESNAYKVFLIDQPEDQLDAITVSETIMNPIQKRYADFIQKGVQLIFVTHDPKIAINLGAINIIDCEENPTNTYEKTNLQFSSIYKKENDFVKKVDGKKIYVHKRSEIYGKRN